MHNWQIYSIMHFMHPASIAHMPVGVDISIP